MGTGSLRVWIKDTEGNPIEGIPIWCEQSQTGYGKTIKTNSEGYSRFDGLSTEYFVSYIVNPGGYYGYEELRPPSATIYEGRITERRHTLRKSNGNGNGGNGNGEKKWYKVRTLDEKGNRLAGVKVEGRWYTTDDKSHSYSGVTDSNGDMTAFWEYPERLDHWNITSATKEGYEPHSAVDCGTNRRQTITLKKKSEEGIAEVIKVEVDKTTVAPGENLTVTGWVKNNGSRDKIKLILGIFPIHGDMEYSEKVQELEYKRNFAHAHTFTIPSDFDRDSIKVYAIGYHEE